MKVFLLCVFILLTSRADAQTAITSPNRTIAVTLTSGSEPLLSVQFNGRRILDPSPLGMRITGLKQNWSVRRTSTRSVDETIISPVPEKRREIRDHFNELTVEFRSKLSLQIRVYNDGFAYRFLSALKDSIVVEHEIARYALPSSTVFYGPAMKKREDADVFHNGFEEPYMIKPTDSIPASELFFSPVLVSYPGNVKVAITESDLEDYPGMFLRFAKERTLEGVYAPYPLEFRIAPGEFPQEIVTKRAEYIARTKGTRSFPWRVFIVSEKDTELPSNDLVYRLGAPSRVKETDWIKPGQGTDEWIIGINLFNVPFKAGINTATYKYYIDFAKRFGFERIMMDAGWSENMDLLKINPNINMDEIAAYAKAQGVSLSMWTLSWALNRQLEPALKQFNKWGVDFIMTDFMDRDDQKMVNFYHRIAKACADHKIMIMYHGAFKPAGFSRTWPNAITREGVLGSEYNIWSNKAHPDHDLLLPFIRMTAGPMDYEPGILDNATKTTFRPIGEKVMSMGTRMHQAAMFVVYESPIQLFSGNPSQGMMEPEFMELVGSIPTVWDETIILDGKLGEYIVTARRRNNSWYIGAMSNWEGRTVEVDLSFLPEGNYAATIAQDGINADRYPSDYLISKKSLDKTSKLPITMAKGGGFVAVLTRME